MNFNQIDFFRKYQNSTIDNFNIENIENEIAELKKPFEKIEKDAFVSDI
jgi:hypothetical protein